MKEPIKKEAGETVDNHSDFEQTNRDIKRLLAILDGIDDVIYVSDPDSYELLHVNKAFKDFWGDDTIGQKCFRVIQGRDAPCPFCTNDKIFGEYLGRSYLWEFQNEITKQWFRCADKAIQWINGKMVRFELASNISSIKETEEKLRKSEIKFKRMTEMLPDMIYCMSLPDGQYTYVSPASRDIFGYGPDDFFTRPLLIKNAIHPDWHEYFAAEWEKLLADQAPPTYEYQIITPDGQTKWLNQRNVIVRDEDDRPNAIWGIVTDVTLSKKMEHNLRERIKELNCIQGLNSLIEKNEDPLEILVEKAVHLLAKSWQYSDNAIARISIGDISVETDDIKKCVSLLSAPILVDNTAAGLIEVGYNREFPPSDEGPFMQEERDLIDTIANLFGTFLGRRQSNLQVQEYQQHLESLVEERTAKFQQEAEMRKKLSEELTVIIDSIPGLVFYKDKENNYIRVNKYVADAHQMSKEKLEGKSCYDLYPKDLARAYHDDDLEVINSGTSKLNIIEPWETEQGTRWVSTSKIPFINEKDQFEGIIGVAMDITEQKLAEETIKRKEQVSRAINQIFSKSMTCKTEEAVAKMALQISEELTESKFGFIGEINTMGKFDTIALSDPGWDVCKIEGSQVTMLIKGMEIQGLWGMVLQDGKSHIVNDPEAHTGRVGIPKGHPPLTSYLGVPFLRNGKAVGMISLANKEKGYSSDDVNAIETLSGVFYEVLLRKRMELGIQRQNLLKAAQAEFSDKIRGNLSINDLAFNIISYICSWLHVPTGVLYVSTEDRTLHRVAGYAHRPPSYRPQKFLPGEGLVGQAALEKKEIILTDIPEEYFKIESGLGEVLPRMIVIKPIVHNDIVRAVIELGTLKEPDGIYSDFLDSISENIAYAVESAQAREIQSDLLEESQRQNEELQAQQDELQTRQEELRVTNEELEEQTQRLRESEDRLKTQQEELQVTNEELEEKNELLEEQKRSVERARKEISEQAAELALASKYKSEFLANMSHELRTPLNSLLLLAKSLSENKEENMTDDQLESMGIIYQSGHDLLSLINEILDLSKIEAGRMDLHFSKIYLPDLQSAMIKSFKHLAAEKGLEFEVTIGEGVPESIISDRKRIDQILKNLVSNAIKFTDKGKISITFGPISPDRDLRKSGLKAEQALSIAVSDTGIGIAAENHNVIFEAFKQIDSGIARKFGGTGLGLSIARDLAILLGGEIQLTSQPDCGSTFTVFLPLEYSANKGPSKESHFKESPGPQQLLTLKTRSDHSSLKDDRGQLEKNDRIILIIEDDLRFAEIIARQCRERGFKVITAPTGESGVELARQFNPHGILLDLKLPGIDGWRVLEMLKDDPATRHIPVHIASVDEPTTKAMQKGAVGYIQKPVTPDQIGTVLKKMEDVISKQAKRVLVIEDDFISRKAIVELIADTVVTVDEVSRGDDTFEMLKTNEYDCMILDLGLQDVDGIELLNRLKQDETVAIPPVIVYTGRDLSWEEDLNLRSYSDSIIIKGVKSDERLIDEVSLFLHRVVADMPEKKRQVITSLHDTDAILRNKKVLIVDDDMRTLFALTKVLSDRDMHILKAENGQKALKIMESEAGIDAVLMDIMMPILDGYETIKQIRRIERHKKLPIIALTAKAMKDDQKKCIEAGANDYLPKPVDQDRLLSMLRVWLYR